MYTLILLRHGESIWNKENRFTGWVDVPLSDNGTAEAKEAGRVLKKEGYEIDVAFTSMLKRAIKTLWLVLEEMDRMWIPVNRSWRLNERHYGGLQGLNKAETAAKHGADQVQIWRRSYDIRPPALTLDDSFYPGKDYRYKKLNREELPRTECLMDVVGRFLPYWKNEILPVIRSGERVLIAAHGNSLRALVKYLDKLSDEEILKVNIPTAIPLVYELDTNLKPIRHFYLGDEAAVKKASQAVASQAQNR